MKLLFSRDIYVCACSVGKCVCMRVIFLLKTASLLPRKGD